MNVGIGPELTDANSDTPRSASADVHPFELETSERLRSNHAQTPPKTRRHQGPEHEARLYDSRPCTVCKTSIRGSNPDGASKILNKLRVWVVCRRLARSPNSPRICSSLQRATSVNDCIATSCRRDPAGAEVPREMEIHRECAYAGRTLRIPGTTVRRGGDVDHKSMCSGPLQLL